MALDFTTARAAARRILDTALGGDVQIAVAPDQLTPPCLLLGMPTVDYQAGAQATDSCTWPLFAVMPRTHDEAAVERCDRWISRNGKESVRRILMEDQSWDGTVAGVFIRSAVAELLEGPLGQLPVYRWEMEVHG